MSDTPTIGAAWRRFRDRFAAAGIEGPALDARLLAQKAFGLENTAALISHEPDPALEHGLERLEAYASRRLAGEPVARILGEKDFFGLDFILGAETLVPRPETELLVEHAIAHFQDREGVFLDLGTGTGCISIALLANSALVRGIGVDLSPEAVEIAKMNAQRHSVAPRLDFAIGSWYEPVAEGLKFDAILSNPPYIDTQEIENLAQEVRLFDPKLALDGGLKGLEPYQTIAKGAFSRLKPGGSLMVEIGYDQGRSVPQILADNGFCQISVYQDLSGVDRLVTGHVT